MSGTLDAYVLTEAQKTDIRRYCGYSVIGSGVASVNPYLFFESQEQLEFRLLNLSQTEGAAVVDTYLAALSSMEQGIINAVNTVQTAAAGPWQRNRREMQERESQFSTWCRRLASFLGCPPGPYLSSGIRVT